MRDAAVVAEATLPHLENTNTTSFQLPRNKISLYHNIDRAQLCCAAIIIERKILGLWNYYFISEGGFGFPRRGESRKLFNEIICNDYKMQSNCKATQSQAHR